MAPDQKSGSTYGMEGAAAPISNEYLVAKALFEPGVWSKIESLPDPNAFLHAWVGTAPALIALTERRADQICYVPDEAKHAFTKAKTGVGAVR